MAMKGYSTFPRASGLGPLHQIVKCHIKDTCWVVGWEVWSYPSSEMQSMYSTASTQWVKSSSWCYAISTDIPDPLSPHPPIVHCFRQILYATSRIGTELLYVSSSWTSCEGIHWSTSLMSSSLLLQQCPVCLVRLILIVFVMCGRWPYSCCLVGCCLHFNIARSILV